MCKAWVGGLLCTFLELCSLVSDMSSGPGEESARKPWEVGLLGSEQVSKQYAHRALLPLTNTTQLASHAWSGVFPMGMSQAGGPLAAPSMELPWQLPSLPLGATSSPGDLGGKASRQAWTLSISCLLGSGFPRLLERPPLSRKQMGGDSPLFVHLKITFLVFCFD